ncbi:hemolysin family protein [Virgifigura deserti]|uniref:hemolysin family protein n=1 Tax=Virgifigura deserti TaxID=2268457 RepID=UPI003CCBF879
MRSPRADGASDDSSPLQFLRNWLRSLRRGRNGEDSLRHAIEELIEEREAESDELPIGRDETSLLLNILKLRDLTAYDVMVPRADIIAVPIDIELTDLVRMMSTHGHSRIPVYRETLDDVVGMVHIKDVLACSTGDRKFNLASIARQVLFVAPSMRALDLLLQMRLSRIHMALVVDEFGGIDGLITIEDVVEEIVGEIEDEHDIDEGPKLIDRPDGTLIADARATIDEFEERVGPILSDEEREEDIDTLGGLVFSLTGRIPSRGELITHPSGVAFEVLDADPRRIKRLRVRNLPSVADDG